MRDDLTVIYYTANREDPVFEERIRRTLQETSEGIPIISVSQKPIALGTNICVGDVGWSMHNGYRQLQLGAKAATTRFVCTAESDCLYPPEYFQYQPESDTVSYKVSPVYLTRVMGRSQGWYCPVIRGIEGAVVIGREWLIAIIEQALAGYGQWRDTRYNEPYFFRFTQNEKCSIENPIVMIKTEENLHTEQRFQKWSKVRELSYWGRADDLVKEYCAETLP
jgi:hypothetical protein